MEREPVWSGWVLPLLLGRSFPHGRRELGAVTPRTFLTPLWLTSGPGTSPLRSGPQGPLLPSLVLPGIPEISSICLFKVFKPSRRSVSEETLVVEFRGIIWVGLCKMRHWSQPLFVYVAVDFYFLIYFLTGGKLFYNVVLVSALQQCQSAVIIHILAPSPPVIPAF